MTTTFARPSMLLLVLLAALVVLAFVVSDVGWNAPVPTLPRIHVPVSDHAVDRHGGDAALAHQCLNGDRQGYLFRNMKTKRTAVVCWLEDRWGIVILDDDMKEITAFVSDKLQSVDDLIEYMSRQGYQ